MLEPLQHRKQPIYGVAISDLGDGTGVAAADSADMPSKLTQHALCIAI
jgi:hypothetical protein